MKRPGIPPNESERLLALRALGLLDTPPEERFDRLTRLARQFFDVEIVLVTLVDADRQWFKSRQGLDEAETARTISFCGHAILEDRVFEVPDALEDPRFHDNPLVVGAPHIRFYAGAPLSSAGGYHIGTLCLIGSKPRELSASERRALLDFAAIVEQQINGFHHKQLQESLLTDESRSQAILDAIPDLVFVVDGSGRVLDYQGHAEFSVAWEALFGKGRDAAVVPRALADKCQETLTRADGTEAPAILKFEADGPAGPVPFEARFKCLGDDEILILVRTVSQSEQAAEVQWLQQRVAEATARAQQSFMAGCQERRAFESLLKEIVGLTNSEHGLILGVEPSQRGVPFAELLAGTGSGLDEHGLEVLAGSPSDAASLLSLRSLLEAAAASGKPMVGDSGATGSPVSRQGSDLQSFLAVPVHYQGRLLAVLGLANRPKGYDQKFADLLRPLLTTLALFVFTSHMQKASTGQEHQIERLSRVARDTTNAVVITDPQGRIEWVNDSFTRITGFAFDEVYGLTPGEVLQGEDTDPDAVFQMHKAISEGRRFELDVTNYTKSGSRFWMHISCDALRDSSGDLEGYIAIEADVTPQKESEARVRALLRQFKKVTANLPGLIYQFRLSPDGRFSMPYVSDALASIFGTKFAGLDKDATPVLDHIYPQDRKQVLESIVRSAECLKVWEERFRIEQSSGAVVWLEGRATPERLVDGSTLWHGFLSQIDDRMRLERAQQEQAMHTQAILDNVVDGIVTINQAGKIVSANPAAERIFGYAAGELLGQSISALIPDFRQQRLQAGGSSVGPGTIAGAEVVAEVEAVRANGQAFAMDLAVSTILREGQSLYIGIMRDISQRKNAEKEIHELAFYDPLTRLPNRRLFYDRLDHARSVSERAESYSALLFIDLDNFKRLNDTAGHQTGDKLLKLVAERILGSVRENDTVARIGGDEFVVLLEALGKDMTSAAAYAENVGEKIRQTLNQPYAQVHPMFKGTPSIGVTLFYGNTESVDELIKQADMAMYQAKAAGRNRLMFFDPYMQSVAVAYARMENELRVAVQEQQFELFYQVQVDAEGLPIGAEALLRWRHPVNGLMHPSAFIPLAEETRLILPIGQWVLQSACKQLAEWGRRPETRHLTLAVNISALQLAESGFVDQVLAVIERTGANANRIKLELTETLLTADIDSAIAKMYALRSKGVSFALDDFGTGYSSLAYLKRMPISQLKIDQSFVRDIVIDQNDAVIVKSIIALANSMGLDVIAEGVETEPHRGLLLDEGCHAQQGYLFGPPMPVEDFERGLARGYSQPE